MQMDNVILQLLTKVVETAKIIGIEEIIIEQGCIRGLHPDRTAAIVHHKNFDLPFESIGINRMNILQNRLNIIKDLDDISINANVTDDNRIKSLLFKNKNLNIEYRCVKNIDTISAPTRIKDDFFRQITFNEEAFVMLSKGQIAMKAEIFTLISDDTGVRFEMIDSNSDVFSFNFADTIDLTENDIESTFVFRYPIKLFLPLLKTNPNTQVEIGTRGVLRINVNDINVMIFPKI